MLSSASTSSNAAMRRLVDNDADVEEDVVADRTELGAVGRIWSFLTDADPLVVAPAAAADRIGL